MADPNFSIPCYYYQTCPPAFTPPPYAFHPFQPPDYSPPTPPYFYHQPQPPPHTPPTSYTPYTTPTPYIEIYPKSLIMEEEQQKGMKIFDEVKAQIAQLANTSEDNNKKFEKMMEGMDLLIRSLKGENLEIHEGSSSNYHPKQMPSENTGYPPGFNPQTPTNFGTQNDQAEEMGLNNRRNEDTNGGMNSADAETINQMQYSSISINPKVRVNSIQNSNVCLPSSASYMTPHLNLPTLMFEEMSERVEIVDMEIKFEVGNASVSILGENVVFNGSGTGVTLEGEIDVEEDEVGRDFDIGDVETEMKPGSEEFRKEEGSENGSVLKGMDEDGVVIQK